MDLISNAFAVLALEDGDDPSQLSSTTAISDAGTSSFFDLNGKMSNNVRHNDFNWNLIDNLRVYL